MRTLIMVLASLVLSGCGGLDESTLPNDPVATTPALEAVEPLEPLEPISDMHLEKMPEQEQLWEVVWSAAANEFMLVQVPVEERFFYPVDVSVPPPELPPAPCPVCR